MTLHDANRVMDTVFGGEDGVSPIRFGGSVLDELSEFDHQQARRRMQAAPVQKPETAADFWPALFVAFLLVIAAYSLVLVAAGGAA